MDELLAQFLVEGPQLIQEGGDALLALERAPHDRAAIDAAFRAFHTLKGSSALFDAEPMTRMLHTAETVLGDIRSRERSLDAATVARLLSTLSQAERWLADIEAGGALPAEAGDEADRLIAGLSQAGRSEAAQLDPSTATDEGAPAWALDLVGELPSAAAEGSLTAIRYTPAPDAYFNGDDPIAIVAATPGLLRLRLGLNGGDGPEPYDPFTCRLVLEAVSSAPPEAVRAVFRLVPDQVAIVATRGAPPSAAEARGEAASRALRVGVERVDALSALAVELVAAKTALATAIADGAGAADTARLAHALAPHADLLDRLVNRLHQGVMGLRLAPVAPLLRRFPRLVREMAEGLGKDVEVVVDDGGVEADKSIVEGLFEPLTHLLRNAVDHAAEGRAAREAAGKPPVNRITLTSRATGGRLLVTVADDGRGVDPQALREAVAARGLMTREAAAALSETAALDLVFLPGFSTAGRVSDLSGRGVGMDAVRAAVQGLGGTVGLTSRPGEGTTVGLALPLAVSLTKILVVRDGDDRYGLPLDRVLQTLRLPAGEFFPIRDGHAFTWRGRTAPLLSLGGFTRGVRGLAQGEQRVVVVEAAGAPVGVVVDGIDDRLDVAVRPLDGLLAGVPGLAGSALLGDGRVLMILDVEAVAA